MPDMSSFSEGFGRNSLHENVEEEMRTCSEREVTEAIIQYQKTYKLPATGKIDTDTIRLMSTSRCGNKDTEDIETTVAPTTDPLASALQNSEYFQKVSRTSNDNRRPWKRSAKRTLLMQRLKQYSSPTNVISHSRRRFLHNHIKNLKEEDPLLLNKRNKRSLITMKTQSNNSESFWDGKKFLKDEIYWRLLENGFSTRIPVEEQSASLNLAFRMWSEVIPVKFIEHKLGDVREVDIEIAFGRGMYNLHQISFKRKKVL